MSGLRRALADDPAPPRPAPARAPAADGGAARPSGSRPAPATVGRGGVAGRAADRRPRWCAGLAACVSPGSKPSRVGERWLAFPVRTRGLTQVGREGRGRALSPVVRVLGGCEGAFPRHLLCKLLITGFAAFAGG